MEAFVKRSFYRGMLNLGWGMLLVVSASVALAQQSIPVTVNCNSGQSLNQTLSRLSKLVPATVSVSGTCTEFVQVIGFENLTLNGLPGATLVQPSTGADNLATEVLFIGASRSVTVSGFTIQANTSTVSAVGIGHGSNDIRLLNLNTQGEIVVFEHSQALLSHVVGQDVGFTPLAIFDLSDVHIEHCVFENSSGDYLYAGIDVGASHVTMYDTTIRNAQLGISAGQGSIFDLEDSNTYTPYGGPSDVVIDGSADTNFNLWGVSLNSGSSLNVGNARLLINRVGRPWGGMTGGILVSDGSTLNVPNANTLTINGSQGQGIVVENNSHATLTGATVTGSGHGGLVLTNLSSLDVSPGSASPVLTNISGNGLDLFCDSGSAITGSLNLSGVTTSQCANVQAAEAALP
jgi:hypothetical protein